MPPNAAFVSDDTKANMLGGEQHQVAAFAEAVAWLHGAADERCITSHQAPEDRCIKFVHRPCSQQVSIAGMHLVGDTYDGTSHPSEPSILLPSALWHGLLHKGGARAR